MKWKTIIGLSFIGCLCGGLIGYDNNGESGLIIGVVAGFLILLSILLLIKVVTWGLKRFCNKMQLYLSAIFIPLVFGSVVFAIGEDGEVLWLFVLVSILVFIFEFMLFSPASPTKPKKIKENLLRSGKLDAEADRAGENSKQNVIFGEQSMKCPRCRLLNPPTATRCDCGYDFPTCSIKSSYTTRNETAAQNAPLFLYIPVMRLIVMSIVSCGLYQMYWIYRNWRYVKERDNLTIRPFWRSMWSIFYCHSLLRRIHEDSDARSVLIPLFHPNILATGWVVLMLIARVIDHVPSVTASIVAICMPSFLCLAPVQSYVNSMTERMDPNQPYYRWSSGHIVCLIVGTIIWVPFFLSLGAK